MKIQRLFTHKTSGPYHGIVFEERACAARGIIRNEAYFFVRRNDERNATDGRFSTAYCADYPRALKVLL